MVDNRDPKKIGRVKVHFKHWGDNIVTDWIPTIRPYGGREQGVWSLPDINDLVLCTFIGGEPSKPVVYGNLYNVKQKPPASHTDKKMFKTKNHEILLDDTPGAESIFISQLTVR